MRKKFRDIILERGWSEEIPDNKVIFKSKDADIYWKNGIRLVVMDLCIDAFHYTQHYVKDSFRFVRVSNFADLEKSLSERFKVEL